MGDIGKHNLSEIRKRNGISVTFVAKYLDISRQSVYNKENGKHNWTALEVQKLCNLYHVGIDEISLQA